MIYTALCVMLLMRAASITWASGRGLGLGNREVFCEMASSGYIGERNLGPNGSRCARCHFLGTKKSRFQGPPLVMSLVMDIARLKISAIKTTGTLTFIISLVWPVLFTRDTSTVPVQSVVRSIRSIGPLFKINRVSEMVTVSSVG